ncbi:MAG: hypothetical protein PHG16_03945 [Lachnospiraceae bacterium]|nr:hypothetical protein [Lachnospiraceae bacterium]
MQEIKRKFIELILLGVVFGGVIGGWLWISIQTYGLNAEISKADYYVFIADPQMFFQTVFLVPIFFISLSWRLRATGRIQVIIRERNRGRVWQRYIAKVIGLAVGLTVYSSVVIWFFSLFGRVSSFNWREKHSLYWDWCGRQVLKTEGIHLANVVAVFVVTEIILLLVVGILFTLIYFLTSNLWVGWLCCEGLMFYRWRTLTGGGKNGVIQKLTMDWTMWEDIPRWKDGIITGIVVILIICGVGYVCAKKKGFLNEK